MSVDFVMIYSGGETELRRILSVIERRWRNASSLFPVPGSPLERIIAEVSRGLGEAMSGLEIGKLPQESLMAPRGW
jgi:hypothetical protein